MAAGKTKLWTAAFVATGALMLGLAGGATAGTWTLQSAATPTMPISTPLSAVSCADPSHCLAVGGPVAQRSHASQWTLLHPAIPSGADSIALNGVSCVSRTSCWVVGYSEAGSKRSALAEHWDGSSWSIESTFSSATAPETSLMAVSCTGDGACEAVGHYGSTTAAGSETTSHGLIERRTASGWKRQSIPSGSAGPTGVSCSSASACTAVGPQENPLRWDGHTWTAQSVPDAGAPPDAVSCPTADSCWGVGTYHKVFFRLSPLVEHWDGSGWQLVGSPDPDPGEDLQILNAVSCSSDTACTAVGNAETVSGESESLTERWNGHAWTVQTTPPPDPSQQTNDALNGVSCPTGMSCTSVGYTGPLGFPGHTEISLAERWNGSSWTVRNTPNLVTQAGSSFTGVSCSSGTHCTAVGERDTDTGLSGPLAERRHGSDWSLQDVAVPADPFARGFVAVSCPASNSCVAVGGGYSEVWDGHAWTPKPIVTPGGAIEPPTLAGVSCGAANDCTAVGVYYDTSQHFLAEHWNGSSWTVEPTVDPVGADGFQIGGVSCRPGFCMAVGYYFEGQNVLPFAETWDGSSWSARPPVNSDPTDGVLLRAVSCSASNACTAVGNIGGQGTVAERWNGSSWTVQPMPSVSGGALFGVSCPAADTCVAVGSIGSDLQTDTTLAEHWDGSAWTVDPTPGGAGRQLTSASCTSRVACVAAGASADGSPLIEAYLAAPRALVVTGDAWRVRRHHATLHGSVDPRGSAVTQCAFMVDAAGSPGFTVPCRQDPGDGSGAVSVSARVGKLTPGTTYRYQLVATNAGGVARGAVKSFETRRHRRRR